ncbi:MFS transporter [Saccharopolyspora erythraea]|uniref:MFS transporter n=1 Tax=Saccharopolyspora erythraea TaxID=1836 RepID=UPI001E4179D8|nr:MFS transporter [Saccharopolyspora erythraea]
MVDHLPFAAYCQRPIREPVERLDMERGTPARQRRTDTGRRVPGKVTTAAVLGTVLEWYDFAIYGAMAGVIGRLFFPSDDPTVSLLVSLASYAVGFVCRPLGAILLGRLGDRAGRRSMLALTMVIVGVSSLLIGLLPTYASVGLLAPALLVALRMLQGLAVGAEWTGGATYLIEHARTGRRGLFSGIVQASTVAGFLLGTGIATVIVRVVPEQTVDAWGWRVPFLVGGVVAAVGLFVRLKLDESPAYRALGEEEVRSRQMSTNDVPATDNEGRTTTRRNWLLVLGIVFGVTLYGYTATSFPTFLTGVDALPLADALMTNVVALLIEVPLIIAAGVLSDRVGRKKLMTGAMALFALGTYPVFALVASGTIAGALLGQVVFVVLFATVSGPMAAMFVELFPTRVRSAAFSSSYNIGVAVFGGTAPFVNTFLATSTGVDVAPAFYLTFGALISLVFLSRVRDGHDQELR